LWFGSEWSIRTDAIQLSDSAKVIETLIDPPVELGISNKAKFILTGAIILDQLWKIRDGKVHENRVPEIDVVLREVLIRSKEHENSRSPPSFSPQVNVQAMWIYPIPDYIKFNTNAAVELSSSSITVVAKNWRGEVVLARSKRVNTTIPLQAEAEAFLWAGHIAAELGAKKFIF
jgi:hypothetical protein